MSLSRIQSLRISAVLEDCSDQLDIVGHVLRVQRSTERGAAAAQVNCTVFITCHHTLHFDLICFYEITGQMKNKRQK